MAEARAPRRRLRAAAWLVPAAAALTLGFGLGGLGSAALIQAKALLAPILIARAWAETLAGAESVRPWPWADTWPIARLAVPGLGLERFVLAGASGRTLAFGPAGLDGTAAPGTAGHSVLTGHRDTHFAFLQDLTPGMTLRVQRPDGLWRRYRVVNHQVLDSRQAALLPDEGRPALSLVTCWPFDALAPGGPLRYVVFAEGEAQAADR